jgi:hypothetical protein
MDQEKHWRGDSPRPCEKCGKHPGTQKWLGDGGALAYSHGFWSWWCVCCALKAQIEYGEEIAARLPKLKEALTAELEYDCAWDLKPRVKVWDELAG